MMKSHILGGAAILATLGAALSGLAVAQDSIEQRKVLMKAVGSSSKTGAQMAKGDIPFDAAKAAEAMGTLAANWDAFVKLFPKGSETGGETTASPKIWENFTDFEQKGQKFAEAARAAQKAAANGPEAFKSAFAEVAQSCRGCHQPYRIRR